MRHARTVRNLCPARLQPTLSTDAANKARISICKNIYYAFIKRALLCKFRKNIYHQQAEWQYSPTYEILKLKLVLLDLGIKNCQGFISSKRKYVYNIGVTNYYNCELFYVTPCLFFLLILVTN